MLAGVEPVACGTPVPVWVGYAVAVRTTVPTGTFSKVKTCGLVGAPSTPTNRCDASSTPFWVKTALMLLDAIGITLVRTGHFTLKVSLPAARDDPEPPLPPPQLASIARAAS